MDASLEAAMRVIDKPAVVPIAQPAARPEPHRSPFSQLADKFEDDQQAVTAEIRRD